MRRARPGSPRVFEPLVELVVPHIIASVCGPTSPGLRRVFSLSMPPSIGCQRHHHENGASYLTSALVTSAPRLLDKCRRLLPLFLGFAYKNLLDSCGMLQVHTCIKNLLDSCLSLRFLRCLQFESGHLRGPLISDASQATDQIMRLISANEWGEYAGVTTEF